MAAPQWSGGKCKSVQQAKAFFRHNDKDRRLEQRHANVHIDKSKTHLNFSYRGYDYGQLCQAYERRMGEIDQGRQSSGKNARTVLQSVVVYPPAGITDQDTLRRWFMRAGDVLNERFGDNFLDMQVDMDENHEYYDQEKGGMVMSREHGHARLVPEVDGKLNGKQFSSRAAITGLNDALQEMSIREFGVPMMDGSKRKGRKTVEQLKAQSEAEAIKAQARQEAGEILTAARVDAAAIRAEAEEGRQSVQKAARAFEAGMRGLEYISDMEAFMSRQKRKDGKNMLEVYQAERQQQGKMTAEESGRAVRDAAAALEAERQRQKAEAQATAERVAEKARRQQGSKTLERG